MLRPAIRRALRRLCREFLACEPNADLRVYVHRAMRRVRKGLGDDRLVLKLSERCRSTAFGARFACLADSDSSVFSVDRIVGMRLRADDARHYLVRWSGFDSDDDTWEPMDRLVEDGCGDLIADFHKRIRKLV